MLGKVRRNLLRRKVIGVKAIVWNCLVNTKLKFFFLDTYVREIIFNKNKILSIKLQMIPIQFFHISVKNNTMTKIISLNIVFAIGVFT